MDRMLLVKPQKVQPPNLHVLSNQTTQKQQRKRTPSLKQRLQNQNRLRSAQSKRKWLVRVNRDLRMPSINPTRVSQSVVFRLYFQQRMTRKLNLQKFRSVMLLIPKRIQMATLICWLKRIILCIMN